MFNGDQLARFARDIRTGNYSLLIGAGASYGGINRHGNPLPLGGEYAEELCRLKGVPPSTPLQRVFNLLTDVERQHLLIDRFSGCTPSAALSAIPHFLWKRIFSLNVDDALQAAYEDGTRYQDQVTRNYRDPLEEEQSRAIVPVIHLHGWTGRPEQGFIFSRDEYVRQLRYHNPWMVTLAESLAVDPFIVMGTSLDEFDLEYYLSARTQTTSRPDRGPSVLVTTRNDAITAYDCDRYDLVPFHGTSTDFMEFLRQAVQDRPTPIELIPTATKDLLPDSLGARELAMFSADFSTVPAAPEPNLEDPKFLLGREPSWGDLVSQIDVARDQYSALAAMVEGLLKEDRRSPAVIYLKDEPGSGKTTLLRRLSFDCARSGVPVLICSALGRIEPTFTASMFDLIDGPLVVAVDNFADQAYAVAETIRSMEKTDVVFLAFERAYRDRYVLQAMSGLDVRRRNGLPLSRREIGALLQNYADAGFLGAGSIARSHDQVAHRLLGDPIAVACCRLMNDFRPLDGIIRSIIDLGTGPEVQRYLIAALAQHCMNGGVRESVLIAAAGAIGLTDQMRPGHHLPLTWSDGNGSRFIVPMNSTIGSRALAVTAQEQPDLMVSVFVSLARRIAPRVNRQAIKRRAPEARLAGRLFDYDEVVVKFLASRSREFFRNVQEEWKWNSRYWEQVALLHLGAFQETRLFEPDWESLDLAVRHARHAVVIERHPLTLTTLGKVLTAQLVAPEISAPAAFTEAFDKFDEAIHLEQSWRRSNVQPYVSLFRGVREYVQLGYRLDHGQVQRLNSHIEYAIGAFQHDRDVQLAVDQTVASIRT